MAGRGPVGLALGLLLLAACAGPAADPTPTVAGVRDARDVLRPTPTPALTPTPTPRPLPQVPGTIGRCKTGTDCYYLQGWETRGDRRRWAVYRDGSGLVEIAIREDAWR